MNPKSEMIPEELDWEGIDIFAQTTMDAVFVLGTGSKQDDLELRYALRSIRKYCSFVDQIYLVGSKPSWWVDVQDYHYLPADDIYKHVKDANIIYKVLVACQSEGLNENFLFCSDDQLVTKPSDPSDFEPRWLREWKEGTDDAFYSKSKWHKRLRETLRRFGNGAKYWEPHIWSPMKKSLFLEMSETYDWKTSEACTILSLYYNHIGQVGGRTKDHRFFRQADGLDGVRHIAYSDEAFAKQEFRSALNLLFPDPVAVEGKVP